MKKIEFPTDRLRILACALHFAETMNNGEKIQELKEELSGLSEEEAYEAQSIALKKDIGLKKVYAVLELADALNIEVSKKFAKDLVEQLIHRGNCDLHEKNMLQMCREWILLKWPDLKR